MIRVDDPDPSWPETFRRLRDLSTSALAGVPVVAIEHAYTAAKSELLQRILERAGLSAEDRAAIAALNT